MRWLKIARKVGEYYVQDKVNFQVQLNDEDMSKLAELAATWKRSKGNSIRYMIDECYKEAVKEGIIVKDIVKNSREVEV
jgi:hypothetical protein